MLPGLDLGDTPSFQTMGASAFISPRDAYPLYFALSGPFAWFTGDPAAGLNLASVVFAALACGALVLAGEALSGSLAAGVVTACLFGGSFTFWSQAIIAEVYALHMLCVALIVLAALRWEREPSAGRLAVLFLVYAVSFGNHLTTAVLMPGLAWFLLITVPGGPRRLLRPRIVALAFACALVGAAQYAWNIRTLLIDPAAPASLGEALRWFWFDVTKADWRDTMVLEVPGMMAAERARMFAFDLHQQFGWLPVVAAIVGAAALAVRAPRRLLLLSTWYAATLAFALTYNVGDTHVFLLPAHLVVALLVAPALAAVPTRPMRAVVCGAALLFAATRIYREYPALDRSDDHRAASTFARLTQGITDERAILLGDLDWQLGNGLNYYVTHVDRRVAMTTATQVLPYAPTLLRDNAAIGRAVYATGPARQRLETSYAPLVDFVADEVPVRRLDENASALPPGSPYVIARVKPSPAFVESGAETAAGPPGQTPLEQQAALVALTGGRLQAWPAGDYVAVAGLVGQAPSAVLAGDRPFTEQVQLGDLPVRIRMDAWLAFDTIRRMGFGQVIAGRQHALVVERGVSLVGLTSAGAPRLTAYAEGLYAPLRRFRVITRD